MQSSYSIQSWCDRHEFSRAYFYVLKARGEAPRTFDAGRCKRITPAADAEWMAEREAASASVAA